MAMPSEGGGFRWTDSTSRRPGAKLPLPARHTKENVLRLRKPATILDVALEAGVSKSTVSNVVRGAPGVSEAPRHSVRGAIERLGYRPNVIARQLVKRRTQILGVVVGDLVNPFFAEIAKLIESNPP